MGLNVNIPDRKRIPKAVDVSANAPKNQIQIMRDTISFILQQQHHTHAALSSSSSSSSSSSLFCL